MRKLNQDLQHSPNGTEIRNSVAYTQSASITEQSRQDDLSEPAPTKQALDFAKNQDPRASETHESDEPQVAALAYLLWQGRGCPEGSPQEDWYGAEQQLRHAAANANA
jgi:hypothetical protein